MTIEEEDKSLREAEKTPEILEVFHPRNQRFVGQKKGAQLWGVWEHYHPNGQLLSSQPLEEGRLHGEVRTYDAAGHLKNKIVYQRGIPHGPAEFYNNGLPLIQTYFHEGKQHGETTLFNEMGLVREQTQYQWGVKQGKSVVYDPFGEISRIIYYHNGLLEGPMAAYYSSGSLCEEGTYIQGKRHGQFISYHENGAVRQVLVFEGGQLVRSPQFYTHRGRSVSSLA